MSPHSLILLASITSPVRAAPPAAGVLRHAVLVGSNAPSDELVPLLYAEEDAQRMADLLVELGGFDRDEITVLSSPSATEVRNALAAHTELSATHDEDLFLFYYSGHADHEGLRLGDDRVGFEELRQTIRDVPAEVRLGVLDACRSGEITRLKGLSLAQPFLGQEDLSAEGEAWLTAASADENAQESDQIRGSFFTHYLMSGLRGAADQGDGLVSLDEAYAYAYDRTVARTGRTIHGAQHPSYDYRIQGKGDLALTDVGRARARIRLPEDMAGVVTVLRVPDELPVAEVAKAAGAETVLGLPPGSYVLQLRSAGAITEARFGLSDGATVVVPAGAFRLPDTQVAMKGGEEVGSGAEEAAPEVERTPGESLTVGVNAFEDAITGGVSKVWSDVFRRRRQRAEATAGTASEEVPEGWRQVEAPADRPQPEAPPQTLAAGTTATKPEVQAPAADAADTPDAEAPQADVPEAEAPEESSADAVAMAEPAAEGGPPPPLPPQLDIAAEGVTVDDSSIESETAIQRLDLRHSPVIGATASFVLPGAGQFYNGQWAKGAAFLGSWAATTGGAFGVQAATEDDLGDWGGMLWTGPTPWLMAAQAVRMWSAADAWQYHKAEVTRPVTGTTLSYGTMWNTSPDAASATTVTAGGLELVSTGLSLDWIMEPGFSLGIDRTGYLRRPDGSVLVDTGARMMFGFFERSPIRPALFLYGGLEVDSSAGAATPVAALAGGGGNVRAYLTPRYFVEVETRVGMRDGALAQSVGGGLGLHFGKPGQGRPLSRAEKRAAATAPVTEPAAAD